MTTQPEALAVAGDLEIQSDKVNGTVKYSTAKKAAALLRTQHADIERKDALLRQALEALRKSWPDDDRAIEAAYLDCIDAITKELAK